jgi:hypothetical protein
MACEAAELALGDRLHAVDGVEEEHLLLDVRRKDEQVEELRHARGEHTERAGGSAAVGDAAGVDGALQVVRERELVGDGRRAHRGFARRRGARRERHACGAAPVKRPADDVRVVSG